MAADSNSRHVDRMSKNICNVEKGMIFQNILSHLESISDQCSDISLYVIELTEESVRGREHEYIHQLHHSEDSDFKRDYQDNRTKYYTRLLSIPRSDEEVQESQQNDESFEDGIEAVTD